MNYFPITYHESRVQRPLPRFEICETEPSHRTARRAEVGDTQCHDGFEVQTERRAGVKREPGIPNDDQSDALRHRVSRAVQLQVGRGPDGGSLGAEEWVGEVDAESCGCCAGAYVDRSSACEVEDAKVS